MKISLFIFIIAAIVTTSCNKRSENYSPQQQAAIDSAVAWLHLIDEGKYKESWQNTSNAFKKDVTQRQWIIGLTYIRKPYGKVLARKIMSCRLSDYYADSGRHHRALIRFQTTFENRETVSEFQTLQLVNDTWRVSIYYMDR